MRDKGADLGVITTPLPKDVKNTGLVEGVWVCCPSYFPTLVTLLRGQLLRVKRAELMAETPKEQKDFLSQSSGFCEMYGELQGLVGNAPRVRITAEIFNRSREAGTNENIPVHSTPQIVKKKPQLKLRLFY